MIIRREQLTAITQAQQTGFEKAVVDFLRREMPDAISTLTDTSLNELIRNSQCRAAEYGIDEPVPLTQFICLTVTAGPRFDTQPDVNTYLLDANLSQTEKMQALIDQVDELGSE